jgi:predicted Zn-dependent protease
VLLARAQIAQRETDAARRTLEQALTLDKQNLVPVYRELIGIESRGKRLPQALALVERLRKAYPGSNVADQALGDVRLDAGQLPQAIAAYEAARRVKFDRPVATRLARAYTRAGQPAKAIATLSSYRKANPGDRFAAVQLAEAHLQARQYRPAVAIYQDLRKQGLASDPIVLNNLAWASHQLRDKRAVAYAEAALKRAPASPAIQDTLGVILVETRRDPKRGLALLQAATRTAPRDANIRFHLAQAYQANGREADAVRELQTALKTPRFASAPQARRLLAQLKS